MTYDFDSYPLRIKEREREEKKREVRVSVVDASRSTVVNMYTLFLIVTNEAVNRVTEYKRLASCKSKARRRDDRGMMHTRVIEVWVPVGVQ